MTKLEHIPLIIALGLIMVTTGCGKTEQLTGLVPAGGMIYCDDAPLEGAVISFIPSSASGRTAVGRSDNEGKFAMTTLITNDGAYPDNYSITVTKISDPVGEGPESKNTIRSLLPQKYAVPATSGLTCTLSEKGDKSIKLEISTKN